jgi:hypothetical protein
MSLWVFQRQSRDTDVRDNVVSFDLGDDGLRLVGNDHVAAVIISVYGNVSGKRVVTSLDKEEAASRPGLV